MSPAELESIATIGHYIMLGLFVIILAWIIILLFRTFRSPKDVIKALTDKDYYRYFFLHRRYAKVKEGKQTYENYKIEEFDGFLCWYHDPKKTNIYNSRENMERNRAKRIIENKPFLDKHFGAETFSYDNYCIMMAEWEILIPVETEEARQELPHDSFDSICTPKMTPEIRKRIDDYMLAAQKPKDIAILFYALEKGGLIEVKNRTVYWKAMDETYHVSAKYKEDTFDRQEKIIRDDLKDQHEDIKKLIEKTLAQLTLG